MQSQSRTRRSQLIPPEALAALTTRSDAKGLFRLGQHVVALLFLGWCMATLPLAIAWIAAVLYSAFLIFSFCPLHESIHGSLFASRWLNQLTGFVLGLAIALPPRYFHGFHMAHHRYTQLPGKDPELLTPKPKTRAEYLWQVSGVPYASAEIRAIARGAIGLTDDFIPQRQKPGVVSEARLFALIYLSVVMYSVVFQTLVFFWFWLLPVLVGQPLLRLFLMAEHTGCPEVEDMLVNTRTTLSNRLMTWFCWNMNHHTAHHAYAGVPFFRLAKVTKILADNVKVKDYGYLAVNQAIFKNLKPVHS